MKQWDQCETIATESQQQPASGSTASPRSSRATTSFRSSPTRPTVRSKGCTACLGLSGVGCKGTVRKSGSSLPIGGAARTDRSRSATSPTLRRPKRPRGCARRADASSCSASPPPMLLSPGHIGRNQVLVAEARKLRSTRPQGHFIACLSDHLLPHRVGRGIVV